jgi:hypothetical protein
MASAVDTSERRARGDGISCFAAGTGEAVRGDTGACGLGVEAMTGLDGTRIIMTSPNKSEELVAADIVRIGMVERSGGRAVATLDRGEPELHGDRAGEQD